MYTALIALLVLIIVYRYSTLKRVYVIKKGKHYCLHLFRLVRGTTFSFRVRFDHTAMYTAVKPINQWDVNKLYGFTESYIDNWNSARIGWSYRHDKLRLHAFTHVNGEFIVHDTEVIVPLNIDIPCSITVKENKYIFVINGTVIEMDRGINKKYYSGWQLYPYFGGDEVAPHDIKITIIKSK